MNPNVVKRMMSFDVIAKIPGKKDALGNTSYETVECKCYPVDEIVTIYDALGKLVTSSIQIYVEGKDGLKIPSTAKLDIGKYVKVTTPGENPEDEPIVTEKFEAMYSNKSIIKRTIYYKPYGIADVGVYYIP